MIVADASLIANFYVGDQILATTILQRDPEWHTSALWRFEVHNALLKYIRVGRLTVQDAESIMIKAAVLIDDREQRPSTARVLRAAVAHQISSYDADYVAVAQKLRIPLVTFDQKLIRAVPGTAFSPADFLR